MNVVENLKNRFATSLLTQGLAATIALHTASALLLLTLFLLVQGTALERQLELRGESIAQFLGNELQFAMLVGDQREIARLLETSSSNEDVLFLEVLDPAGKRICLLEHPGARQHIPALAAG